MGRPLPIWRSPGMPFCTILRTLQRRQKCEHGSLVDCRVLLVRTIPIAEAKDFPLYLVWGAARAPKPKQVVWANRLDQLPIAHLGQVFFPNDKKAISPASHNSPLRR